MNVIGVLVHAMPAIEAEVAAGLAALPGVDVHVATGDGRIVATACDTAAGFASDSLMAMNHVAGVITTSLVYHAFEPDLEPELQAGLERSNPFRTGAAAA